MSNIRTVITGSGAYIPEELIENKDFLKNSFYTPDGLPFENSTADIIEKFYAITGIRERRYASKEILNSDMAAIAGEKAIESADIDKEEIDQIIVAHNFGDVTTNDPIPDMVPSLASRVKHKLKINNPHCIAYDVIFGCPGWIHGVIQADLYIKTGKAKTIMVIGSETLSRVADPYDRDSMIYSDGAGATILQGLNSEEEVGIINNCSLSHTNEEVHFLMMGQGFYEETKKDNYMKMNGRKIYNYALQHVPQALKQCLEISNIDINELGKVLIHQANAKMDEAIIERLFKLYGFNEYPEDRLPMSIDKLGNNSVATVPMLYNLIDRGLLEGHTFKPKENLLFASVGAGMNINAFTYRIPQR